MSKKKPTGRRRGRPKKNPDLTDLSLDERLERYTPYLEDIQKKLFRVLLVFSSVSLIGFFRYQQILRAVMGLFELEGINIVLTSPYQFFSLAVNTGVAVGFVASFPLALYYLFSFLKPALKPTEYKKITKLLPYSAILFISGFAFGVWIVQFVINLYTQTTLSFNISNIWDVGHFFSQILLTGFLLALVFQLPIVMTALIRLRVVKRAIFVIYRRYFYAGILLLAALLPPTDILSLILLTIPPLLLFEIALIVNRPGVDLNSQRDITNNKENNL